MCVDILKRTGNFTTRDEQYIFFQSLIEAQAVKMRKSRIRELGEGQPRTSHSVNHKNAFTFHVEVRAKQNQVSRNAFLSLYSTGEKKNKKT